MPREKNTPARIIVPLLVIAMGALIVLGVLQSGGSKPGATQPLGTPDAARTALWRCGSVPFTAVTPPAARPGDARAIPEDAVDRSVRLQSLRQIDRFAVNRVRRWTRSGHYHMEQNHQGLDNRLIEPGGHDESTVGPIQCFQRLGGMLRFYRRAAA